MVKFYPTSRGWKWIVLAPNGRIVDRADEPFSTKGNAERAFRTKVRILSRFLSKKKR